MKAVIVSYGHIDPVLPLFKHISKHIVCDLVLVFSQRQKFESILSFDDLLVNDGFLDGKITRKILKRIGLEQAYPSIKIFVYHNNRTRSPKNLWLSFRLKNFLESYDVIHFNGQHTTLVHLFYLIFNKKKCLFTIHDYRPHTGEGGKYKLFGCYWNNAFILKKNWPVVIQNKSDYNLVLAENPKAGKQLFYIPFGVFENYLYWSRSPVEQKYDVLFLGRISKYKGLGYLLEAVSGLQKSNPKISLCIAGKGDLAEYRRLIKETKNCTVVNRYVPNKEMVSLLEASRCVVCPYTDATQSGVVMTAFALGKPVIATDVGGFPEVITHGETGFLVKPKDVGDLQDKIWQLLENETLRLDMVQHIKAFRRKMEFNWDNIAAKYLTLYQEIYENENPDSD